MLPDITMLAGMVIGGYRLERVVGRGAASAVFLARKEQEGAAPVAVKVLLLPSNLTAAERAEFRKRFARKAEVLRQLRHPHILPLLESGEDGATGLPFMVLPYVAGGSLADRATSPLPLPEVLGYVRQIAAALDYAHALGVIHRDIKPANVLIDGHGQALLADFGIGKLFDDVGGTTLTTRGQQLGTPEYMAPEQVRGDPPVPQTDVYGLGMLTYQLVTGHVAFTGRTTFEIMTHQLQDAPPLPRQWRPDLPLPAEAVILRALAKDWMQRFATAGAFTAALEAGLQGKHPVTLVAPPLLPAYAPTLAAPAPLATIITPDQRRAQRRERWRRGFAIVGLILLILAPLGYVAGAISFFRLYFSAGFYFRAGEVLTIGMAGLVLLGALGAYQAIRGLRRLPSAPLRLPHYTVFLIPLIVVLAIQSVLTRTELTPWMIGLHDVLLPVEFILPPLTIFALAATRLNMALTWRRLLLSAAIGLIPGLAVLEGYGAIAGFKFELVIGDISPALYPLLGLALLMTPPLLEGLKALFPIWSLRRITTPAEALLLGMAVGSAYAISVGYLTQIPGFAGSSGDLRYPDLVNADFFSSISTGMVALGWFYLVQGTGFSQRHLKGWSCLLYASVSIALTELMDFPPDSSDWQFLGPTYWFPGFPDQTIFIYISLGLGMIALGILIFVTGRLSQAAPALANTYQPGAPMHRALVGLLRPLSAVVLAGVLLPGSYHLTDTGIGGLRWHI